MGLDSDSGSVPGSSSGAGEWIGKTLHGRDTKFPNQTVWRLTSALAEKAQFPDEGPSEVSAVFNCEPQGGPKTSCPALIRVRMQHEYLIILLSFTVSSLPPCI